MLKRLFSFILSFIFIFTLIFTPTYGQGIFTNPPRDELERKIEEVAKKRGIPSVILKSIARVESVFKQYNSDGTVYTGTRGSIGLMQIYNKSNRFDNNRLKYDIDYNIEAGAEILLSKWDMANERLPRIGDMDPNILENWYFALWAYNGWVESNNPNTKKKKHTFQQLVYMVTKDEYGQEITPIDPKLLPEDGLPSKNMSFETPENYHKGDIAIYQIGDKVKVDTDGNLILRDASGGNQIGLLKGGTLLAIAEGPELKNGYYWYRVENKEENINGWVAGNWITRIFTVDYPFKDMQNSKEKEHISKLYDAGIVTGIDGYFYPERYINREELSNLVAKALKLNPEEHQIDYNDINDISKWALDSVISLSKYGILKGYEDNTFRPKNCITREEAAIIVTRILGEVNIDREIDCLDKEQIFLEEGINSVKSVLLREMMETTDGMFRPADYLTRGEACRLISKLYDFINIVNGEGTI